MPRVQGCAYGWRHLIRLPFGQPPSPQGEGTGFRILQGFPLRGSCRASARLMRWVEREAFAARDSACPGRPEIAACARMRVGLAPPHPSALRAATFPSRGRHGIPHPPRLPLEGKLSSISETDEVGGKRGFCGAEWASRPGKAENAEWQRLSRPGRICAGQGAVCSAGFVPGQGRERSMAQILPDRFRRGRRPAPYSPRGRPAGCPRSAWPAPAGSSSGGRPCPYPRRRRTGARQRRDGRR